ncbi:MAG TPA: HAMP domain-containing sensor histidine kinase [Candidatus Dormibacteraeota bacterium]|nr:HAMP domain-containing sensor histidine kinase [Candidatus Dormibacteraeota bacterium]
MGERTAPERRTGSDPASAALVAELVDEFNSASDSGALMGMVLHRAVLETRSDRGVMSWIDGNEMIVAGCHDPFGELVPIGSRWPLAGEQVSAVALAAGRPEAGSYGDIAIGEFSSALREAYTGLKYLLVVPVVVGGEEIAILCVSRRRSEEFTAADSETLDTIARACAHPLRAARLDDMLGAAMREVARRLADAESVERVKTDILRLASHELRSPLTVLHGYLSLVRDGFYGEIPEPLGGVIKILERRTDEMNGLVNDMLVAARVEDPPAETEAATVDLRDLLRDAADSVSLRASAMHRIRVEACPDPLPARVDMERVVLALRNIIDNAVKYSPGGGDVVCCASADDGVARIRVADQGLGIAPEYRDKLFTRFGRVLTTANSHIPGIGLGLYFSREVARRHGGDVRLVDGDAPGSTFELSLPLAP